MPKKRPPTSQEQEVENDAVEDDHNNVVSAPEREDEYEEGADSLSTIPSPSLSDFVIRPIPRKPDPIPETKKNVKAGGNGDQEDGKKGPAIQRLWSAEDEIAVLKGMIRFRSETGTDPSSDPGGFHEFVKGSLRAEVSTNQVMEKVRRMQKKYLKNVMKGGREENLSKPHEVRAFELSKKIWCFIEPEKGEKKEKDETGKSGKEAGRFVLGLASSGIGANKGVATGKRQKRATKEEKKNEEVAVVGIEGNGVEKKNEEVTGRAGDGAAEEDKDGANYNKGVATGKRETRTMKEEKKNEEAAVVGIEVNGVEKKNEEVKGGAGDGVAQEDKDGVNYNKGVATSNKQKRTTKKEKKREEVAVVGIEVNGVEKKNEEIKGSAGNGIGDGAAEEDKDGANYNKGVASGKRQKHTTKEEKKNEEVAVVGIEVNGVEKKNEEVEGGAGDGAAEEDKDGANYNKGVVTGKRQKRTMKEEKKHEEVAVVGIEVNGLEKKEEEVEGSAGDGAAEEDKDGIKREGSWEVEFPLLRGWLKAEESGLFGQGAKRVLREGFGKVGKRKMREWEGKWRKLMKEEVELFARRRDLIQEQVKFVLDGIKSEW